MSFGQILRQLREEHHLTQLDLQTIGLSRVLISHYELGRRLPSYEHLQYFAQRLGVSVAVFFDDLDDDVIHSTLVTLMQSAEREMQHHMWENAERLWTQSWLLANRHHLDHISREIQWQRLMTAHHRGAWEHAVQYGLLWLAHPEWALPSAQYYLLLAILGAAYQKLGQLRTAELFYRLAQDHAGSYTESGLRMALNRGTCAWLLGEVDEAQRLFEFTRVESQQRGFALVEAWATIGWTTIQFHNHDVAGAIAALNRVEQIAMMLEESSLIQAVWQNQVVWARLTNQWDQQRDFLQRLEDTHAASDPPITLLTEHLYRWTHLHAYDNAQDCLIRARTRSAIGIEGTEFWEAAATYFAACQNHASWGMAQRLSQLPTISWADSWYLFDTITIN